MTARNVLTALAVVAAAVVSGALWYESPEPARTAPEAALISALADDLATVEPGDPPVALADEDAVCVAEALVSGVGVERLADLGVDAAAVRTDGFTPAEIAFDLDDREEVVDAFDDCVDLTALAVDSMAEGRGQLARTCVADALAGPRTRELWRWRVGPDTDPVPAGLDEVLTTIDDCLG